MAVNAVIDSTSMSIEIQTGVDKAGDATYSKKTFSNIRNDANPENLYEVAESIKNIMDTSTRDTFVNVVSNLVNA